MTFERDVVPAGPPEADLFYLRMHPAGRHIEGQLAVLTLADLASAIAAMTPQGESGETFRAAERFLKTGQFADNEV